MMIPLRAAFLSLLGTLALAQSTPAAELLVNGDFTTVSYSGTLPVTTLFGQFGTGSGSSLTVNGWATTGYNFVYAPNTASSGTSTGANTNQPNEAPSRFNTNSGYGNTYLWGASNGTAGSGNGGVNVITTSPAGGNFIAADGDYGNGPISQTVNNLTVGGQYAVSFFWAAAQQQGFDGATQESWSVSLGNQTFTTSTFNLPNHAFSGWMQQTFVYTATTATATLSFLANGSPSGQPPFSLLSGVSLVAVPEPSAWMLFIGVGAACTFLGVVRRRRRAAALADGLDA